MKMFKNRKGMTLTEVIIALIIISVIVVGMMGFFSTGFNNIFRLRSVNRENFAIQEYFEEEMAKAKREEGKGTESLDFNYKTGTKSSVVKVQGMTLQYPETNRNISLFVANHQEATLDIPDDITVSITGAKPYYYVGQSIPEGKMEIKLDSNSKIKMTEESFWFLSDRSIGQEGTTPIVGSSIFNQLSSSASATLVPKVPDDFKNLNAKSFPARGFEVPSSFRGKYLTYGGRAINTYGRVGAFKVAPETMWIMGIPITDKLATHTDADLVTTAAGAPIETTDQPTKNGDKTVVRNYWDGNSDTNQYKGNVPVWNVYEDNLQQTRQFIAFQGDRMWFTNQKLIEGTTTSLLIGNKKQSGPLVSFELGTGASDAWKPTLRWSLNLAEDGQMTTTVDDPSNLNLAIGFKDVGYDDNTKTSRMLDYNQDHSIQIRTTKVSGEWAILVEVFVDDWPVFSEKLLYRGTANSNVIEHNYENARLVFGGHTYINEFAMYTRALPDAEIDTLATYFKGKYDTTYNAEQP